MTSLPQLLQQSHPQLLALAAERGLDLRPHLQHDELVADIVLDLLNKEEPVTTDGILTILPEGFGFVRMLSQDFASTAADTYVSGNQIRTLNLQVGQRIRGPIRAPRGTERTLALVHVDLVEDAAPEDLPSVPSFASRAATTATRPMPFCALADALESCDTDLLTVQTLAPMCFGHRAVIHAPTTWPRARLLARMAHALEQQHPGATIMLCLLEQRPEDIAAARQLLSTSDGALVSTAFASAPERHVAVAELALQRCLRQVEQGRDVIFLIDSLTALTRARSRSAAPSGAWIQPGLDAKAILPAKHILECAQQCADGGSLTVIATVTQGAAGSIDEAIKQEFAAHSNSDIVIAADPTSLDPTEIPLDVLATQTRPEDDPTPAPQQEQRLALRLELAAMPPHQRATRLLASLTH